MKSKSKNLVKEFFYFVGLTQEYTWLKDKFFYFALFLGPLFCIVLSFFIKSKFFIQKPFYFLINQFFLIAFPEELFFRGALLPFIKIYFPYIWNGISLANVITALFFAGLHLITHPFLWAIGTFFPGIIFGYFREKHNSLWPAIFLHFFYNTNYYAFFGGMN